MRTQHDKRGASITKTNEYKTAISIRYNDRPLILSEDIQLFAVTSCVAGVTNILYLTVTRQGRIVRDTGRKRGNVRVYCTTAASDTQSTREKRMY